MITGKHLLCAFGVLVIVLTVGTALGQIIFHIMESLKNK